MRGLRDPRGPVASSHNKNNAIFSMTSEKPHNDCGCKIKIQKANVFRVLPTSKESSPKFISGVLGRVLRSRRSQGEVAMEI